MTWRPVAPPPPAAAPQYANAQGGAGSTGGGSTASGPAFIAHKNATQAIPGSVATKVQFEVEDYDTAACFTEGATSRFQPNVAGFYQVNAVASFTSPVSSNSMLMIYKNGAEEWRGTQPDTNTWTVGVSGLVYLNGTTDYIEAFVFTLSARTLSGTTAPADRFSAFLARPA